MRHSLSSQPAAAADPPSDIGTWSSLEPFELECVEGIHFDHLCGRKYV